MLRKIKDLFNSTLKGRYLPVISRQLKGIWLKIDPLVSTRYFWASVEQEMHNGYNRFIKEGDIIFDIGANTGLHSYYFARKFKNTLVYAFEPLPANAAYARDIIAHNKINNIIVVEKAVGDFTGTVFFDDASNNAQGHITDQKTALAVAITSLDDLIQNEQLIPDFIKIDVEGAESKVLDGFKRTIEAVKPVMIIELHTTEQRLLVADFFRPLQFALYRLNPKIHWAALTAFTHMDNLPNGDEPPEDLWGMIVAIPLSKVESFRNVLP